MCTLVEEGNAQDVLYEYPVHNGLAQIQAIVITNQNIHIS